MCTCGVCNRTPRLAKLALWCPKGRIERVREGVPVVERGAWTGKLAVPTINWSFWFSFCGRQRHVPSGHLFQPPRPSLALSLSLSLSLFSIYPLTRSLHPPLSSSALSTFQSEHCTLHHRPIYQFLINWVSSSVFPFSPYQIRFLCISVAADPWLFGSTSRTDIHTARESNPLPDDARSSLHLPVTAANACRFPFMLE